MKWMALLSVLLLAGCSAGSTIEKNVNVPAPLPIGGSPDSGFLYKTRVNGVVVGAAFNQDGYDWYSYLLGRYGANLKPPRTTDFGVTKTITPVAIIAPDGARVDAGGTVYTLNREAAEDLYLMATWSRSDEHPKKTLLQKVGL